MVWHSGARSAGATPNPLVLSKWIPLQDFDLPLIHSRLTTTTLPPSVHHVTAQASPTATTKESERLAGFACIGGLLLVAGLVLVLLFEQFRPTVFLVFMFMALIAPSLSAAVIYWSEFGTVPRFASFDSVLFVIKAVLLGCLLALIAFMLLQAPAWFCVPIVVFLASAAVLARCFGFWPIPSTNSLARLDAYLIVAVTVAVFVLSPFNPAEPVPIGLLDYALGAPRFGVWLLIGILWTLAGIWLRRHEGWAFPQRTKLLQSLAASAVGLVILGLYDDSHFTDFSHYVPLVGPAMHVIRGGIPMVDSYSQYGFLPWFIQCLAFKIFEPTFGTAAVVVRLNNLCYFAVIFLILLSVTRRRLSALWFFVPALLVAITSHGTGSDGMWNMNSLPMTLGGRYLLPASMTLLLIAAPTHYLARWGAFALIMLASLSSVEILAFTLAPWGYCLLLDAVRSRSPSPALRWSLLACATIVTAQGVLIAAVYLWTGALVDYRPYFDLISQYRPVEESPWSVPFVPNYALWFPLCFAYFVIMAAASYRAFRGDKPDSIVERLLPVAILGMGPLAYFFGRPQEATLNLSCLSFTVVAIGIAEVVFINPRRFGNAGYTLSTAMALAFSFTITDGFEHFMRPLDPSRGNSTILRRCFTDVGCPPGAVLDNVGLALHTQPLDPRTKVGDYARRDLARIDEVISMLRRLGAGKHQVGMLADYWPRRYADSLTAVAMTAFMTTGQWYAWSLSSPINDGQSPMITNRILNQVAATPTGMLIIVSNQKTDWAPINYSILETLLAHCTLSLVEVREYHSAFMTENCHG